MEKEPKSTPTDDLGKVISDLVKSQREFLAAFTELKKDFDEITKKMVSTTAKNSDNYKKALEKQAEGLDAVAQRKIKEADDFEKKAELIEGGIAKFNPAKVLGAVNPANWFGGLGKMVGFGGDLAQKYYDDKNKKIDANIADINSNKAALNQQLEQAKLDGDEGSVALLEEQIEQLEAEIAKLQGKKADNIIASKKVGSVTSIISTSLKKLGSGLNKVFETFGLNFKQMFSEIVSDAKKMFNTAAKFSSGSIFGNSEQRETRMKYGLSASGGYAMSQTMSTLEMNESDLMYMNDEQKAYFADLSSKYQSWYEQMEATGVFQAVQEAQLEFKMFKQEISMKLLTWFAAHKDQIMKLIEGIFTIMEGIFNVVSPLIDGLSWLFGGKSSSSSAAKSVDTWDYSNYSPSTTNTFNQNNTYNGIQNEKSVSASVNDNFNQAVKGIINYASSRG